MMHRLGARQARVLRAFTASDWFGWQHCLLLWCTPCGHCAYGDERTWTERRAPGLRTVREAMRHAYRVVRLDTAQAWKARELLIPCSIGWAGKRTGHCARPLQVPESRRRASV